jgi:hypothetical protein
MSALGQKQTRAPHKPMSAKCQKRTLSSGIRINKNPQAKLLGASRPQTTFLGGLLPLPSPAEKSQRAEAGGEKRESGGEWSFGCGRQEQVIEQERAGIVRRNSVIQVKHAHSSWVIETIQKSRLYTAWVAKSLDI